MPEFLFVLYVILEHRVAATGRSLAAAALPFDHDHMMTLYPFGKALE